MIGAFALLLVIASTNIAQAQDRSGQAPVSNVSSNSGSGILTGAVKLDSLRINRLRPSFAVDPNAGALFDTQMMVPREAVVNSQDYSGAVFEDNTKKSNYIWGLSRDGGYYDASGQIKVVVPGDQLYKYGGTFMDGSKVPTTPVVTNFAKHAYRYPYVVRQK